MRYEYNHDYFASKDLKSCYWAGFLAGDGWIYIPKKGQPVVATELASKDKKHIEAIRDEIGGGISHRTRMRNDTECHSSRWYASSSKLAQDLDNNFNVKPNKSMVAQPPQNLNEKQEYAFIAGLVDADGSYMYSDRKKPRMKIVGTKPVLDWVNNKLFDDRYKVRVNDKQSKAIYSLEAHGDKALLARSKYIDMDLHFLERKYRYWENNGIICD